MPYGNPLAFLLQNRGSLKMSGWYPPTFLLQKGAIKKCLVGIHQLILCQTGEA
jgi:hypothetical protein